MDQHSDTPIQFETGTGSSRLDRFWPLLRFMRRRPGLVLLWPALALVLGGLWWWHLLGSLERQRHAADAAARRQVAAYAQDYAARSLRAIVELDRVLLLMRRDWKQSDGAIRLEGASAEGIFSAEHVAGAAIVDRGGEILTSTHPIRAAGRNMRTRPQFVAQENATQDRLYISAPMHGKLSDRVIVSFSRRIAGPGQRFDGVAMVSVLPSFFTASYAGSVLGRHDFLGLSGTDGITRAVYSAAFPGPALWRAPLPQARAAVLLAGARWFADGRDRYVAAFPVDGSGLVALVGLDRRDALAGYWRMREDALAGTWWNTAWVSLATILATCFFVLSRWKKHQLDAVRATYRLATEDAGDGFFINRPVRGPGGRVEDFIIVDCNQHGAEQFGLSPPELVGRRLTEFYQGEVYERIRKRLCEALEKGIYDNEIKVGGDKLLSATWIRYKVVRAGGDLAVTIRDISESKLHLQEMERRSNEDELTGLPNRYWIHQYLPRAIEQARAQGSELALLFIDLDGFKTVNDALGHAAGDELLRTVARRLKVAVRPQDHVVRLGGDEFVILIEQIALHRDVEHVAERVLAVFGDGFHLQQSVHVLGASIGISMYPEHGEDPQTLLKNADIAMYSVKTDGKGSYRFFEPRFFDQIRARLDTEMELRSAIELKQFVLHYQPRVDLGSGGTSGMEALVRWAHPTRGLLGPDVFIPLAEETGLIGKLGELVIDGVCRQLCQWGGSGQQLIPVSVNVSPRQFTLCDVPGLFGAAIARYGLDPALLEIEVTESSMMQEGVDETRVFRQLRELGIRLCIDDFGTGYSSMSQLQMLRFDVLKIDRAFVHRIDLPEGDTLVSSMVAMAHALGMRVVAEGVETRRQMQHLKTLGCDEGQGYFFSRPIPPGDHQPQQARAFLPAIGQQS